MHSNGYIHRGILSIDERFSESSFSLYVKLFLVGERLNDDVIDGKATLLRKVLFYLL